MFRYVLAKFVLNRKERKPHCSKLNFPSLSRHGLHEDCHLHGGDFLKAVSSTLITGETRSSETSYSFYMTVLRRIPGDSNFDGDLPKK